MNYITLILFLPCLFICCLCEITEQQKVKLLADFLNYYNLQPNHEDQGSDGYLQSVREISPTIFRIEVSFAVNRQNGTRQMMKCSATVADIGDQGIGIVNNDMFCSEVSMVPAEEDVSVESVEDSSRGPVKLENEVQADTAMTSGEQFIAIPRDQPRAPCIGCSAHVNPQAAGVSDLANLGVRHLDLHEPTVKHSLESVIDVERQVQVINGVRYILMLSINFNNCTEADSVLDLCTSIKACKISILEKPWQILPSGGKYRAILANNCTEEWQFGDNGEVLPEVTGNRESKEKHDNDSSNLDNIKAERHEDSQSQPNQEKVLTMDEIKAIEEQILPHDSDQQNINKNIDRSSTDNTEISKDHVVKVESIQRYSDNNIPVTDPTKEQFTHLSEDKKQAIDEMLDFLNFSGLKARSELPSEETIPRVKRSYDHDLKVLSVTKNYRDLKNSLRNAKYVYDMAQTMVDYLNEIDMEVKNRAVTNVIKAEEEDDNEKRFVYIQAQVVIPCGTAECDAKKTQTKICNGVIDCTNQNNPRILNTFCYFDTKETEVENNVKDVISDDPVLRRLTKDVLREMESETEDNNAIKIKKILAANTRIASGRVTKISMVIERLNCNKSVPLVLRTNCSTLQNLGSNICEVIIYEKHWLKEKKISYTCTERPIDMTILNIKGGNENIIGDDPKIIEILEEALQNLELRSNKKYKQKIVKINKISTQIIAGFLINVEFIVGYTNCTNGDDLRLESNKCELLKNERLRACKAQIWDRSWIVDGKQMEVTCDENQNDTRKFEMSRIKRSLDIVEDDNERVKRQMTGGLTEQDPSDPKYKQLADESLHKYLSDTGNGLPHKVVKIEKVTTQVVSGSMTRIDFVASPINSADGSMNCHSEIWEQSWLHKKDITVSCLIDNQRVKRQILGGLTEQDPSNPEYNLLAKESLNKYLSDTGNGLPHKVVRIEKVTTQVVAGSLTNIDFVATPTDSADDSSIHCHSEIFEQAWLHKKEITVSCLNSNQRVKRQMPGGLTEQDPSDPKYKQLADESLHKYLSDTGNGLPHKVVKIEKVTTQVVSGSMTRIDFVVSPINSADGSMNCHSEIWEQSWLHKKDITVSCLYDNQRMKRQILGGLTEQDPSNPAYKLLADESLHKYLSDTGNGLPHKVVRIEKVTTQVVAGSLTSIDFVATPTDSADDSSIHCHSEIFEQAWLDKKQITVSCLNSDQRVKRQMTGGLTEQDPSDPKYKQLADESLHKYLSDTGNGLLHKVVRIAKVTTQVVAGSLTRIDFVASPIDSADGSMNCHSEIWEQAWLHKKEITVSCLNDNQRMKRQIFGGLTEQDPSNPEYKLLAKESLNKYLSDTGNGLPHKVVRIEKVTTQVVAGSLTNIDFVATPTDSADDSSIHCHSEIFEQAWLDKKQITVSCLNSNQRVKRQITGGLTDQDPSDPKYKQLADESLHKYISDTGNGLLHKVVRIVKVTTQVVAGSLTRIDFVASPIDSADGSMNCHSEIWEQAWLHKKEITVSCLNNNERVKRQIAGGFTEQDPSNPEYKLLAIESLNKYLSDTGNGLAHKVLRIEKVTTQVVSGSMTRIDFVASPIDSANGSMNCHSEIWEQAWLDKREITVSCLNNNERVKRQIAGGLTEQDPSKPEYKLLAIESLNKYLSDTGNGLAHKVLRIEKVTTQVVSGSMTRIDFVASPIDSADGSMNCHSEIWEQAWLDKKEITVSCVNSNLRVKRQIPGGLKEQDPSDPKYKQLADDSLHKYLSDTGNGLAHKVVRIEKVTTQVVAGSLTRIDFVASPIASADGSMNCHSEIWEQAWLDKKEITVSCVNSNLRVKRQIPGGLKEQDPSDPKYKQLADESLHKYLSDMGNGLAHKVVRIEKVTTQVVAGSLTRIDFVASPIGSADGSMNCHSEIWEQAWLHKKEITVSCLNGNQRVKRQILGGLTEQDPSNPVYKLLAEKSLNKYLSDTGNGLPHKVARIERVTTQVVAGSLTSIDFVATPTDSADDRSINCHSEIFEQAWLDKKEITVSCVNSNLRVKRQIPGGLKEQDPSDPKYKQLADESLHKYLSDMGNGLAHKVVRIEKVTTQVVAGSLTRIDFVASPIGSADGSMNCHSEIWEQAWLHKKEITVSCLNGNQRVKRQILGGLTEQDPSNLEYKLLAEESLNKYLSDTGNGLPHKVVRIDKVTTQVVSGSMTRIDFVASPIDSADGSINCHSEIWEQAWLHKKNISVSCRNGNQRVKRRIKGVFTEKDLDDPKYKRLAEESLQKYLSDTGKQQPYKVVRVEKVNVNNVSGLLTRLRFIAIPTDTTVNDIMNCYSEVLEQPWLGKKDFKVSCQSGEHILKRKILSTITHQDPNDKKYLKLADESLKKYLSETGNQQPFKVVRVDKVTIEYVAGYITRINFVVAADNANVVMDCFSKILEQKSQDQRMLDVDCETNEDPRLKRELRPGHNIFQNKNHEEEQDVTKPQYQLLASQALRKFSKKKGILHRVTGVDKVLTRIVSGIIYKIDFTAQPTECSFNVSNVRALSCKPLANTTLYCHTEIWDQPWIKKTKIDVECNDPFEIDYDDYNEGYKENESSVNKTETELDLQKENTKVYALAEEALEEFLSSSNRKYVFRITEIHSFSDYMADGLVSKLEFSIAPTLCLRNSFTGLINSCEYKKPKLEYYCKAKIVEKAWLNDEKSIKIHCHKPDNKTDTGNRLKRQIGKRIEEDDNEIDEETTYYYADRAVQHLNEQVDVNNLYKLITIHAVRNTVHMKVPVVKMFIEVAETYCLRQHRQFETANCEEMEGLNHRLCLARIYPSVDDDLVVKQVTVTCDDNEIQFNTVSGLYVSELLRLSILELEKHPERTSKLVHQGEPQVIPSLDSNTPTRLNFVVSATNCSKDVDLSTNPFQCYLDTSLPAMSCTSKIWLDVDTRTILNIVATCNRENRKKRAILNTGNVTIDDPELKTFMSAILEKLEMASMQRYKQRILHINSYSSKITSGRVTTIDFDVAYTSCLKYEWIENMTTCDFLEHLPRRHCIAQIWQRLWINNGMNIDVSCEDDETPLEAHVEFESAEMANQLAQESLKHIEAKYPNAKKQKVVRIFSLEKQVVAGVHYRMKLEVGSTDCVALSDQTDCKLIPDTPSNKFCRVNVWVRPWTDHPPNFRVTCDYQDGASMDLYRQVQAEHLFYNFLATYNPSYVNDHAEMEKRFQIFKANVKKIHELNVHEKGTARYGVTRFADLTYKEFSSRYMGLKTSLSDSNRTILENAEIPIVKMPISFDWREYGVVTEVKDQGQCANSWAFSVTGNIESQWKIQSEKLESLSEQQLLDCDKIDNGCSGGLPAIAYRVIKDMGGLQSEAEYPYEGEGDQCLFNETRAKVHIRGAVNITSNETGMAQWLVFNGPISVGLNGRGMQFYMSGVAHPWQTFCAKDEIDHAALIVGYGVKDYPVFHRKIPYWVVKNSWGKSWGEEGYYLLHRGSGTCGINQMASSAVLQD